MMPYDEYFYEVCSFLPNNGANMTDTERNIIKQRYEENYTPEAAADDLKYNLGGYSLEEYIADMAVLDL